VVSVISFKYRPNKVPVVAKGVISTASLVAGSSISPSSASVSSVSANSQSPAQFAFAWKLIAQIGIYIEEGRGQSIWSVQEIIQATAIKYQTQPNS
jgi:hypothetical protein